MVDVATEKGEMNLEIHGYSERGMIYALVLDIFTYKDKNKFISEILVGIHKFSEFDVIPEFDDFKIYIEQSFSDFGDADLLIVLLNGKVCVANIFVEAKVKTYGNKKWNWDYQLDLYLSTKKNVSSSNLFTQIFHKMIMMNNLDKVINNIEIQMPTNSTKQSRKLGENLIVREMIKEHVSKDQSFYIGLVPLVKDKDVQDAEEVFKRKKVLSSEWDRNFGIITYSDIKDIIEKLKLDNSVYLYNYKRNCEQVDGNCAD